MKAKRRPAPQEEEYYFAWVCSAIEINRRFSEAYVWRALSGNELFCRRGRIRRLKGWDRTGAEWYYDADCAVLDVLIATALQPQWDWALCASGVMGFMKAIRLRNNPVPGEDSLAWSRFARDRLSLAARLAAGRNHPVERRKSERLILDIDYWTEHGIVPAGSDVEWLDAD